jgi:hypothetical protein
MQTQPSRRQLDVLMPARLKYMVVWRGLLVAY